MPNPTMVEGPTILRVGERNPTDKKFAVDEFVFAAPGTIVAPRPHDMEPTMDNAIRALVDTALKTFNSARSGTPKEQRKIGKAQDGYVVQQGDTLWSIAQRLLGNGSRWRELLAPSGLPENFSPGALMAGTTIRLPGAGVAPAAAAPVAATAEAAPTATTSEQSAGDLFAGSQFLQDLLGKLLTDDVGRLGIPQLQQNIFESLGFVAPSLYGVTDPAEFRKGLEGVIGGTVAAQPTAAAQQAFQGILAPLANPMPGITEQGGPGFGAGQIPTLALRANLANRILRSLGAPLGGGNEPSV